MMNMYYFYNNQNTLDKEEKVNLEGEDLGEQSLSGGLCLDCRHGCVRLKGMYWTKSTQSQ